MKTFLYMLSFVAWIWALIRLWRSPASNKVKIILSLTVTLLPFGAFLLLANKTGRKQRLRYTIAAYVLLMMASACVYGAGFRWYKVHSVSMNPTIIQGEHVIGRLSSTYPKKAKRFDIVIYRTPQDPRIMYTSRIIGMPGDHVLIHADTLLVNGKTIKTLAHAKYASLNECDIQLDANSVFVLGDNEENSLDSRSLGPIPLLNLAGYLLFKK